MNKLSPMLGFLGLIWLATVQGASGLEVRDAWVREAPPGAQVLAAYMVIDNLNSQGQALTGASSPACERVEIHRTEIKGDMASMVPQSRLEIPAGGSAKLEPNGYHLMLIGPKAPVRAGASLPLTLTFDNGPPLTVSAEVRPATAGDDDHAHHHHHH